MKAAAGASAADAEDFHEEAAPAAAKRAAPAAAKRAAAGVRKAAGCFRHKGYPPRYRQEGQPWLSRAPARAEHAEATSLIRAVSRLDRPRVDLGRAGGWLDRSHRSTGASGHVGASRSWLRSTSTARLATRPIRRGIGVVVFSTMTSRVADFVQEVSSTDGGADPRRVDVGVLCSGDDGWSLLRAGASDVFTWRDPAQSARHVAERLRRWRTIDELVGCQHVQDFLVGDSPAWQAVLRDAVEVARFTDAVGAGHR